MLLSNHHISILHDHSSSIWSASCSPDFRTEIIRLTGIRVKEDKLHLDLFVPEKYSRLYLKNVADNPKICLSFASIYTYEAYQIKGLYQGFRPCSAEEHDYQAAYMKGFVNSLLSIGLSNGLNMYEYLSPPCLRLSILPQEIYEQTPKKGAGTKIA